MKKVLKINIPFEKSLQFAESYLSINNFGNRSLKEILTDGYLAGYEEGKKLTSHNSDYEKCNCTKEEFVSNKKNYCQTCGVKLL